jgi:hypothetical protein
MAHRSFLTALRSASAPLFAAPLLAAAACVGPSDPKFHYDTTIPLDEATVWPQFKPEIDDRVWATIVRLIGNEKTPHAVGRVLSDYGAACEYQGAVLRCRYGRAWILRMPSPIPFIGDRFEEHADIEIAASTDARGHLHLEACATTYSTFQRGKRTIADAKRDAQRDCTRGTLADRTSAR